MGVRNIKLPFDILKKFAKEVSKKEDTEKVSTFYGVVDSKNGDEVTVKLDGSDISTPVECTMDVEKNDRVMVQIKDHKVVVIGNSTSPASARTANAYMKLIDDGLVIGRIENPDMSKSKDTTDEFFGDGETKVFTLTKKIKKNGVPTVAYNYDDMEEGVDYEFSRLNNSIRFFVAPEDGLSIVVTYPVSTSNPYLFLSGDIYYIKEQSVDYSTGELNPINPSTDNTIALFKDNKIYLGNDEQSVVAFNGDKAQIRYVNTEYTIPGAINPSGAYKDLMQFAGNYLMMISSPDWQEEGDVWEDDGLSNNSRLDLYAPRYEEVYLGGDEPEEVLTGHAQLSCMMGRTIRSYFRLSADEEPVRLYSGSPMGDLYFDLMVNKSTNRIDLSSDIADYIHFNNSKIATAANLFPILDTSKSISKTVTIAANTHASIQTDEITVPSGYTLYGLRGVDNNQAASCSMTRWGVNMTGKKCYAGLYNHTGNSVTVTLTFYYLLIRNTI